VLAPVPGLRLRSQLSRGRKEDRLRSGRLSLDRLNPWGPSLRHVSLWGRRPWGRSLRHLSPWGPSLRHLSQRPPNRGRPGPGQEARASNPRDLR